MPLVEPKSHSKSQLQESVGNVICSFPGSVVRKDMLEKGNMECRELTHISIMSISSAFDSLSFIYTYLGVAT